MGGKGREVEGRGRDELPSPNPGSATAAGCSGKTVRSLENACHT